MISKNMINLCSLNVNGIHGREKRNRVVEWIKTQKCSIAFFTVYNRVRQRLFGFSSG